MDATERGSSQRLLLALRATVVVGTLAVLILLANWWSHPDLFYAEGPTLAGTTSVETGGSLTVQIGHMRRGFVGDLTIKSITAQTDFDKSQSEVSFWICRFSDVDDSRVGSVARPKQVCHHLVRFLPGDTLHFAPDGSDYLLMTVTPTEMGATHFTGITFDYASGDSAWSRRGSQHTAVDITIAPQSVAP